MTVSWEAFRWALTEQESGGDYGAVGPVISGDRAYGRYQVMGNNVGSWTAKYYGRRLTPQEYLANRAAQDAVVNGVLGGYFKKYGPQGAAAMWYSGQSDPTKTYGNPPVYQYVREVVTRAGGYTGQSSSSSSGGGTSTMGTPVTPQLSADELAASYGLTSSLINSNKELKKLFSQAVSGGWTADLFQAKLKNTGWWKNQSDTLRQYLTQKYTDPATWGQKNSQARYAMNALAVQVGLGNQLANGKVTSLLNQAVYNSVALGWSDARVKDWFGAHVTNQNILGGEVGEAFDKIHQVAYLNGMKYNTWYFNAARNVVAGRTTMEEVEATIRKQAAAKYSGFADQIKAGQNVMDLAAPYIKATASILELPDTDVDLFNSHVAKAMTANQGGQPYSLWQYETDLRSDPLWKKTKNAQDSMMQTAHQVLQQFGVAY